MEEGAEVAAGEPHDTERAVGAAAEPADAGLRLGAAAGRLYGDLRLTRILERLLEQSGELLDAVAGSVSIVDAVRSSYLKAAERGASCQLGRTFPLDEGITGQVARRRGPVVLPRYSDVPAGHLPAEHPTSGGAVAAVPIWWRGDVLGVNVVFAGRDRRFTGHEVDRLELLSQVPAAGIVSTAPSEPALADVLPHLSDSRARARAPLVVTEVGAAQHRHPGSSRLAHELVALLRRGNAVRAPTSHLRVVLLHQADRLRVVVHDDHPPPSPAGSGPADAALPAATQRTWSQLVASCGGSLTVERVPGWGMLVLADLPHRLAQDVPPPLPRRQQEVLSLLAQGLTDRQIAEELVIAPKTVEKHVGAVLRRTGTSGRTAAVLRALEWGWLPPVRPAPPP